MLETLNKINEMMDKMSTEQMLGEIKNLKQDISMLDEQLDRFIELFQMAMAEQAFDEFIKKLEEMLTEQLNISNDIIKDKPNFQNLESRENNQIDDFKGLKSSIRDNIKNITKFSSKSGSKLDELIESDIVENTEDTVTLLNKYIDDLSIDLSKDRLKNQMKSLYTEAQDLDLE